MKSTNKNIVAKCKASKDLKNGMSKKLVAKMYDVVNNIVSTFVRNKETFLASQEK